MYKAQKQKHDFLNHKNETTRKSAQAGFDGYFSLSPNKQRSYPYYEEREKETTDNLFYYGQLHRITTPASVRASGMHSLGLLLRLLILQ